MTVIANKENLYTSQNEHNDFKLTKEQLQLVENEHELHLTGKTKSYNWDEAKEIIRGLKSI